MIDASVDNDKSKRLPKDLKVSMSVDLAKLIIGHFYDDCMGGLGYVYGFLLKKNFKILSDK